MPYNPSTGVYTLPPIYLAVPGTVIIAAQHNDPLVDLATANNYPRPIIAGGTGANNTDSAATELEVVSYGSAQSLVAADSARARRNISPPYSAKSGAYTAVADDIGVAFQFTAAATLSIDPASTLISGWWIDVFAAGGAVTIDPNASETINGSTTYVVPQGCTAQIYCDGSNFFTSVKPAMYEPVGQGLYTISGAAAIFTNLDPYIALRATGFLFPSAQGEIGMQFSVNNGSTWISSGSSYRSEVTRQSDTSISGVRVTGTFISLTVSNVNNTVANGYDFKIDILNFNKAARSRLVSQAFGESSVSSYQASVAASEDGGSARNALRFISGASTLTGFVVLEGVRG